ncbi:MAG TPA: aldo/keto reductase, partial [Thermomicrobiaceae bacterium]|nr:aldo/keto reductase [Thermomicrobiaceae bacterium]
LGRTGLKVAPLCLGGNVFGWTADEQASFAVLDAYVEGGGDFIDTADSYSRWVPGHTGGESETVVGKWLKARGNREQVVIVSKVGSVMGDNPRQRGLSRRWIMEAVEDSLRRLQTDYIDLYLNHWDDLDTEPEETMRAFDDLVEAGKVRYVGASNISGWRLMKSQWEADRHGWARYEALQPLYNLARREPFEREMEAVCRDQGLGVITYSSLASGFFSGKYRSGTALPGSARATGVQRGYMNEQGFRVLDAVDAVAANLHATPAQVALAWIMARPSITAPIASATTPAQVRELLGAAELKLDADAMRKLDQASAWQPA